MDSSFRSQGAVTVTKQERGGRSITSQTARPVEDELSCV
jgi:hypothetical protein